MERNIQVPENVREYPAGPDGNGFVLGNLLVASVVGSDGRIYMRKQGEIFLAPEEAYEP